MSPTSSHKNSPTADKERVVWTSVAKLSRRMLGAGALLVLAWMIVFATQAGSLFIEMRTLSAAPEGSLGYWWVLAAIGAPLAVLGLCLYFLATRELRRLSRRE